MDDRMAADSRATRFQLPQSFEIGSEKETLAVGIVNILSLNEKSTVGLIRLLDTGKIETGDK